MLRTPSATTGSSCSSFSSAVPSISDRYSALARWSDIGVPSVPSTDAASRTVSTFHGAADERGLGRARAERGGSDAAESDARGGDDAVVEVEREAHGDARDVVEAALRDLVERGEPGERQRDPHRADELVVAARRLPVAGEELGEVDLALAVGRGEHDARLEGEQGGRRVADGRRRCRGCRRSSRGCG